MYKRQNQIRCQLDRITHLIGHDVRRVGLSATIGDPEGAAAWLSEGTGRETDVPLFEEGKIRWRLGLEHFYIQNPKDDQSAEPADSQQDGADDMAEDNTESGGEITDYETTLSENVSGIVSEKTYVFYNKVAQKLMSNKWADASVGGGGTDGLSLGSSKDGFQEIELIR